MSRQVFRLVIMAACLFLISAGAAQADEPSSVGERSRELLENGAVPDALSFTENRGQWPDSILFQTQASGTTLWFTETGTYYQFSRSKVRDDAQTGSADQALRDVDSEPDSFETIMIKAELVGCNPGAHAIGLKRTAYTCNYFRGNDPDGWFVDVPNYQGMVLEDIYPGIDLVYFSNRQKMEYDFRVAAGADYSQIQIQYRGAENLKLADDGALEVTTAWGMIRELAPVVYQEVDGRRRAVAAKYRVHDGYSFGFELSADFDPARPVVIDPVLVYSTYLGGEGNEGGRGLAVDGSGSVYLTGETFSADFPTYSPIEGSLVGYFDAFVTKLNPAGNALIYSSFLGGTGADGGYAIAVGDDGSAYVTGFTASTDFPAVNAYQNQFNGAPFDAFVVKLSSTGNALEYSTYLGGSLGDNADGIAVDASGAAYLTGYTASDDFPTRNPYQATFGGEHDAFITKLSSSGSSLTYSTFLGGSRLDDANGIAVDGSGAAYVTGWTRSPDFPTNNAYQPVFQGAIVDAFIAKLSSNGRNLTYGTYLGGTQEDHAYGIAVDALGAAYVTGKTQSDDFPTVNPYQATRQGGYDGFIAKLSGNGSSLEYGTYLGGSADDFSFSLGLDATGSAYVTGQTFSTDFPVLDAYQNTFQGGTADAFVTKVSGTGSSLTYSTFLGGSGYELGVDIAVNAAGAAYITGLTDSHDFPTRVPYQEFLQVNEADIFVTMLADSLGPDIDSDGIPDIADNCPQIPNTGQGDINGDGTGDACCCVGRVGDVNNNGDDEPTIGDISLLIDAKFIAGTCVGKLVCLSESDINQSGGSEPICDDITIGDISFLIDYLFIAGPENSTLPDCL